MLIRHRNTTVLVEAVAEQDDALLESIFRASRGC